MMACCMNCGADLLPVPRTLVADEEDHDEHRNSEPEQRTHHDAAPQGEQQQHDQENGQNAQRSLPFNSI